MARVYCRWSGERRAPWYPEKDFSAVQHKKNRKAKNRRWGIDRLHTDTVHALRDRKGREDTIPFCGDWRLVKQHRRRHNSDREKASREDPLRLMVVFWSPGKVVAKRHSVDVENTAEHAILSLLKVVLKQHKTPTATIIDITYVLPRWKAQTDNQGPQNRFASTPPADLAYGVWRLGLHALLTNPDVVLSTSIDVARVISHSSGLDPTVFASEDAKAGLAQLPVIGLDPTTTGGTGLPIKRQILGVRYEFPPSGGGTPLRHMRLPHPYLMSSDSVDGSIRKQHQILFARAVEHLVTTLSPSLNYRLAARKRPAGAGEDAEAPSPPPKKRLCIGFDARSGTQPVLVMRARSPPPTTSAQEETDTT
jgi:hypothetical protein